MNTKGLNKKYTVLYKYQSEEGGSPLETRDFDDKDELNAFVSEKAGSHSIRVIYGWEFKVETKYELTGGQAEEEA